MHKFIKLGILSAFIALSLMIVSSVNAQRPSGTSENRLKPFKMSERESTKSAKGNMMFRDVNGATPGARKIQKLSEARIKVCEKKSEMISKRVKSLLSMGEKNHVRLDNIVERVDEFYLTKLEPEGKTLENYDILKADLDQKQGNVHEALEKAQTDGQNISCDSEDPKTQADTFRKDIQALISAHKEYKKSVRNFVVAVRDLAKEAKALELTPIPSSATVEEEGL